MSACWYLHVGAWGSGPPLSDVACCPDRSPAASGPILLDLAAVRAGGRRPAREIATRELRSEWSISKPGQALPPPTGTAAVPSGVLHTGGAAPPPPTGTAAWPSSGPCSAAPSPATLSSLAVASSRSGIGAYLLPGQALPLPTGTAAWPSSGPCDTTPIPATMSGLDHSRINKPSTTCAHAQWCNACPWGGVRIRGWACWCGRCTRSVGIAPVLIGCSAT